jgi:hypothetical protein
MDVRPSHGQDECREYQSPNALPDTDSAMARVAKAKQIGFGRRRKRHAVF